MDNGFTLRAAVQTHCAAHGLSQRAFADRIGIHPVTLSRVLNGHARPGLDVALKLAAALDLDVATVADVTETAGPA